MFAADPNWWRQASVYQIYPRSFADGSYDVDDYRDVDPKVGTLAASRIDHGLAPLTESRPHQHDIP